MEISIDKRVSVIALELFVRNPCPFQTELGKGHQELLVLACSDHEETGVKKHPPKTAKIIVTPASPAWHNKVKVQAFITPEESGADEYFMELSWTYSESGSYRWSLWTLEGITFGFEWLIVSHKAGPFKYRLVPGRKYVFEIRTAPDEGLRAYYKTKNRTRADKERFRQATALVRTITLDLTDF